MPPKQSAAAQSASVSQPKRSPRKSKPSARRGHFEEQEAEANSERERRVQTPIWWERCAKLFFPERQEFA